MLRKRAADTRDIRAEIEAHIAECAAELEAEGMTPEGARRAAERRFGDVERIVGEGIRQRYGTAFHRLWSLARGGEPLSDLLRDVRFALRMMRKNPGFTALAVTSLALGIGFNTTVFSVVDAVLLAPPGVEEPERLVRIVRTGPEIGDAMMSYPDLVDLRSGDTELLTGVAGFATVVAPSGHEGRVDLLFGESISHDLFEVLGVTPLIGRAFAADENATPGSHPVAMIGERLWRSRYGADPGVLGRDLVLAGEPFRIVGVVPDTYAGGTPPLRTEFWVPAMMDGVLTAGTNGREGGRFQRRGAHSLGVAARLAPGVGVEQAAAHVAARGAALAALFPETNADKEFALLAYRDVRIDPQLDRMLAPIAAVLMGVVGLVLLIACANVANMMLARASTRGEEMAVRRALGANASRLTRQLLTESVLLALTGGALGALLATLALRTLLSLQLPAAIPVSFDIEVDQRVLAFTGCLAVVTGVLFGLVPAVRGARADVAAALQSAGRPSSGASGSWLRSTLVVVQVSVSLLLLVSASLLVRSLWNARAIEPGVAVRNVVGVSTELGLQGYAPEEARRFHVEALERVRALPGVQAAAYTERLPLDSSVLMTREVGRESRPEGDDATRAVDSAVVSPDYFDVLGIPILAGRAFAAPDDAGSPRVAIVNPALGELLWPGEAPLGRRIEVDGELYEVVGLNRPHKIRTLGEESRPHVYLPYAQEAGAGLGALVARVQGDPAAVLAGIRRVVAELDPDVALFRASTMEQHLSQSLYLVRLAAWSLALLGLVGAVMAAAGVYGVVSFALSRRTREIGVRMAIGADRGRVQKAMVAEGMRAAVVGVVLGLGAALAATRVLGTLLYGVGSTDWLAFGAATGLLLAVALVANLVPARRASRIAPADALRGE